MVNRKLVTKFWIISCFRSKEFDKKNEYSPPTNSCMTVPKRNFCFWIWFLCAIWCFLCYWYIVWDVKIPTGGSSCCHWWSIWWCLISRSLFPTDASILINFGKVYFFIIYLFDYRTWLIYICRCSSGTSCTICSVFILFRINCFMEIKIVCKRLTDKKSKFKSILSTCTTHSHFRSRCIYRSNLKQ